MNDADVPCGVADSLIRLAVGRPCDDRHQSPSHSGTRGIACQYETKVDLIVSDTHHLHFKDEVLDGAYPECCLYPMQKDRVHREMAGSRSTAAGWGYTSFDRWRHDDLAKKWRDRWRSIP